MKFLKRHYRVILPTLAALYAVFRYARNLGWAWLQLRNLPFVSGPSEYLIAHPWIAAALGVVIFGTVFAAVRYALR